MTTDLQRMRQDEWLADLLTTDEPQGSGSLAMVSEPRCALGRAVAMGAPHLVVRADAFWEVWDPIAALAFDFANEWLGINDEFSQAVWRRNDLGDAFADIAAWFKEQRDLSNGDLSEWTS